MGNEIKMDTLGRSSVRFMTGGRSQKAHHTWFRGDDCNFNPVVTNLLPVNAAQDWILPGWLPPEPLIGHDTKIVAFGSCFASNITAHLGARNYSVLTAKEGSNQDAYIVRFGEGMVNTFVIRQQFEWAFESKVPQGDLWHGYDAKSFGYDEEVRLATKSMFDAADVFIITLGLSEVWYDAVSGGVFWRAVPANNYDPARHKFRVATVAENKENIAAIYRLIRKYRPDAKAIFTLSPIPLVATFRPVSCITANASSKAILRAALDEVIREIDEPETLFYWPAYELVMELFADRWGADRRHVKAEILTFVMTLFETVWCHGSKPSKTLLETWIAARIAAGTLPPAVAMAINGDLSEPVARTLAWLRRRNPDDGSLIDARMAEIAAQGRG